MKNKSISINVLFLIISAILAALFAYSRYQGGDLKSDPIVFWVMLIGGIMGLVAAAISLFWTVKFMYSAFKKRLAVTTFMILLVIEVMKYTVFALAQIDNNATGNIIWPLITALELVFYARRMSI